MLSAEPPEGKRLTSERDFYRRLLDLGGTQELEPLLDQTLALIVEVTGASMAYLELYDDDSTQPRYWKANAHSDHDVVSIRDSISREIIARAVGEGRTIETPSATEELGSSAPGSSAPGGVAELAAHAGQAVLCAPVGRSPPMGVVYLQGRTEPGIFTTTDRERAELFARQLAPLADRLVHRDTGEQVDYTREIRQRLRCPEFVGRSKALAQLLQSASDVAALEVDVLITGPSGTGKSMLARTLHNNSPRAQGPFIELNCATLPESQIESELVGAERGAPAAVTRKVAGKVAAAAGGTLFLDEVAELSAGSQVKLLQLLEAREDHALGGAAAERADVRIICATNANLQGRVAARQFREDLYYRIHVVPLELPGLDARRDDIPELVEHFAAEACRRHRFPPIEVSRRTLAACRDAAWPGHTRQLSNAIRAAVIRAHGAKSAILHEHHVFPGSAPGPAPLTLQQATRQFQRRVVLEALEKNDWNVSETARELDLARSHLYNLINDFELRRDDGRERGRS